MRVKRAFTLVELLVVISIIALLISILLPSLSRAREQVRAVKCLANLHGIGLSMQTYASEYDGTLPGPVHPAMKRALFNFGDAEINNTINAEADRQKSLTWLLRPYFSKNLGQANREDTRADKIASCPTAPLIVPDAEFFKKDTGSCWDERPYSYSLNSWGPISSGSSIGSGAEFSQTYPPHYFGAWFYCDGSPDRGDLAWWPKKLDRIKRAGDEWAIGDAWYRRQSTAGGRGGGVRRQWKGTFAPEVDNYLAVIPDRPYHRIAKHKVSTTERQGNAVLPQIKFEGATNMVYLDGHAGAQAGQWDEVGTGGTINPMWDTFGGPFNPGTFDWNPSDFR